MAKLPNIEIKRFGRYEVIDIIAKGGMGEVYLAKNKSPSGITKFVAIKTILNSENEDAKRLKLFRKEAEIAVGLNHNNIAAIYEVGENSNSLFLVMEFISGVSLLNIMNRSVENLIEFSTPEYLYILTQILNGLSYAHRYIDQKTQKDAPIYHCDICPQNILVNFEGEVKIIDFGVARQNKEDSTNSFSLMGKIKYISPERGQGAPPNYQSDLYSTGILMWEMLNKKPYFNDKDNELLKNHLSGKVLIRPISSHIKNNQELAQIFKKLIAPTVNESYQSAEEALSNVRKHLNNFYPDFDPTQFRDKLLSGFPDEYARQSIQVSETLNRKNLLIIDENKISKEFLKTNNLSKNSITNVKRNDIYSNNIKLTPPNFSKQKNVFTFKSLIILSGLILIVIFYLNKINHSYDMKNITNRFLDKSPSVSTPIKEQDSIKYIKISVNSNPPNADIYLNGQPAYRRTPTQLPIEIGKVHNIEIKKKGFKSYISFIHSESKPLNISLKQADD